MWPPPLALIALLILCTLLLISLYNLYATPCLGRLPLPSTAPQLSVLIPARNEEAQIAQAICSLQAQTYAHYEVIILDDCSEDQTRCVAQQACGGDLRFKILAGLPLPGGWQGKNWACEQLAAQAAHPYLLFADADVRWRPEALAAVAAEMSHGAIDALTVWPTQETITWGERLVVPLMSFAISAYLPVWLVNSTNWPYTGVANGQCFCITKQAYKAIGGHAAIRNTVLDDVTLAQRLKQQRFWMRTLDGAGLVHCRMYHSWRDASLGYAKNILAGHGQSRLLLLLSAAAHLLLFVAPWLWLVGGAMRSGSGPWIIWPVLLIGLGVSVRMVSAYATRQRLADGLLMPVSVLLMSWIALLALYKRWQGTLVWKGRNVDG